VNNPATLGDPDGHVAPTIATEPSMRKTFASDPYGGSTRAFCPSSDRDSTPESRSHPAAKGHRSGRGSHARSGQESALDLRLDQRNFWTLGHHSREVSSSNKKRQEEVVRYRTAAILSTVLIGGMFCLPAAVFAVFPNMRQGSPIPILLGLVVFCVRFRWFLALPITTVLFTLAAFKSVSRREVRR
jgi:hypothetical protein